jgi:hypothetical protein
MILKLDAVSRKRLSRQRSYIWRFLNTEKPVRLQEIPGTPGDAPGYLS